ncbi:MAG: efflux RND transporter permease subunit [Clostridia bacterium]|nr:efflux RND transporter permease subunit [Clostridia bacterium]
MKKFFSFIIKQSVAIVLIVIFVLGFGIYSTTKMSVNLLPDISIPMVCVQVIYPGVGAQSVEKDVTEKLEDGLSSISGITGVDSYSYDNLSAVVLSFDYGTDTTDKKTDIQNKLSSIDLPDSVITSVYDIDLNAEALATLSVTSEIGETDDDRLKNAYSSAEAIAAKISAIDGVESVEIKGGAEISYEVTPFIGLELIAPLLVQAFSYGELDLPLGNLTEEGGTVQIRNNSDVAKAEDIENMPLKLPSSLVALLSSVKQVMGYYEDSTVEELEKLREDLGEGVIAVLQQIDEMSAEEVDDLSRLKTYMNIAGNYTAEQLKSFKSSRIYSEISKQVEGKDDDEIDDLAEDIKAAYPLFADYLTADMLKVVRDGKIDLIIDFRESYLEKKDDYNPDEFYELSTEDYFVLETRFVQVYSGVYDYNNLAESDITTVNNNIEFAKKTSATGLKNIADKKEKEGDNYNPTDAECALLFTATELSSEHPIITSPTFIAFVRSDSYEENMERLIEYRGEVGEEFTADEWDELYTSLDLAGVFEFRLSKQLFGFIMDTDFSDTVGGEKVVKVIEVANVNTVRTFSSYVYFGGGSATIVKGAIIEVYKSNGANSSRVVDEVKKVYAEYLAGAEANGANVVLLDDQSEFISDSISNVLVSMLIGGALAVLIIFVFLKKVRTSLIVAITMPLSVLAALICLFLMGITLNMVSLGGLAVGIGMLVDNSIVVIESISKHRDKDKTAFEAAVDGTTEVGGALFGSTLTTVCVFIPIIFSGGLTGEIFTDLSWAVIWSLTFSLIVAVTVIPALYALFGGKKRLLKGGRLSASITGEQPQNYEEKASKTAHITGAIQENTLLTAKSAENAQICVDPDICANETQIPDKKPFKEKLAVLRQSKIMDAISNFYGKLLPKVLNKKLVTVLTAVVIFGASIGLLFLTGSEFLPSIDKGQIEVNMTYGSNADLNDIQDDVYAFAQRIQSEIPDVDYVSVSVGKQGLLALTDTGLIKVQLNTNRGTDKVVEKIRALTDSENKPVGTVTVKEIDGVVASLMSGADDLSVTIVGEDGETLKQIAHEISLKLEENKFTDVKNSSTETATEFDLRFDRMKMSELGLDYQTLVLTLRIGLASYTACTVTIDGSTYDLNVKFDENSVPSVEALKDFVVGADGDGKAVKLRDICGVTEKKVEACIRRTNGKQMISVSAALHGVDTGTASKQMQNIAKEVLSNPEYAGYGFESSGISSYLTDAFEGLAVALVISFFLLFAVMAVQFSSAVKPLIVMASIPFSFTGGFVALVITGTSLNVVSFIGLIMLMGVVVNNAIVMLEKIKQLHDEGMEHFTAVQEACKVRLRPIFMTTLTTILALIPMAIGVGQGSELMQPLGIVVIGGLLIGTLVTLLLVPTVYCAVHRLSSKNPNGKRSA